MVGAPRAAVVGMAGEETAVVGRVAVATHRTHTAQAVARETSMEEEGRQSMVGVAERRSRGRPTAPVQGTPKGWGGGDDTDASMTKGLGTGGGGSGGGGEVGSGGGGGGGGGEVAMKTTGGGGGGGGGDRKVTAVATASHRS